jgi:hypothetical protein
MAVGIEVGVTAGKCLAKDRGRRATHFRCVALRIDLSWRLVCVLSSLMEPAGMREREGTPVNAFMDVRHGSKQKIPHF